MSSGEPTGVVRAARRPPGWKPVGPQPAGPGDREDLWPSADEDLCFLTGDWRIFQRLDGHRWSLDDLATAWYAARAMGDRTPARHLDLGCGIGSVLMMIAWRFPGVSSVGVEAQAVSAGLAERSVAYNGASDRVSVRQGDLRNPAVTPDGRVFDLITGTPPYIPLGHGVVSDRIQCGPCRHETRGGIEAYCDAAARLLAPAGRFAVCESADQVSRVEDAAEAAGLQILERLDLIGREGKSPLFSVFNLAHQDDEAARGLPRSGVIEEPLTVRLRGGKRTPRYGRIRSDMGLPP